MEKAVTKQSARQRMRELKAKNNRRKQSNNFAGGHEPSYYQDRMAIKRIEAYAKQFAFELPENFDKKELTKDGKKKRGNRGRNRAITEKDVRKLEVAFAFDHSVEEACIHAGVMPRTYYDFLKRFPDFSHTISLLRNVPVMMARQSAVAGATHGYGNSMDFLSRKKKEEFSPKFNLGLDGSIKNVHEIDEKGKAAVDGLLGLFERTARAVEHKYIKKQESSDKKA